MIKIDSVIFLNNKEIKQAQYITEHFIVTEINEKRLLFIPNNHLFLIDVENKNLKEIDFSKQALHIKKMKTVLGKIKSKNVNGITNFLGYKAQEVNAKNVNNENIELEHSSVIVTIPGMEETIYSDFSKFEQNNQLVILNLKEDQIIASMNSKIYSQGNLMQKQSMKIIDIETGLEDKEEFYEYLSYLHE